MAVTTSTIALKDGSGASQTGATAADPAGVQRAIVALDQAGAAFYRASAIFAPVGTADRTVISIKGSATKTVRISKIALYGTGTIVNAPFNLTRTSALGSGGTAVNPTIGKVDSGTVASATAVVAHYTSAAQSLGTPVGQLGSAIVPVITTGTTVNSVPTAVLFPEAGGPIGQAIVLRGTSDFLEVNCASGNFATSAGYVIEWSEDGS